MKNAIPSHFMQCVLFIIIKHRFNFQLRYFIKITQIFIQEKEEKLN